MMVNKILGFVIGLVFAAVICFDAAAWWLESQNLDTSCLTLAGPVSYHLCFSRSVP